MTEDRTYFNYLLKRNRVSFWVRRFFIKDLIRHFHGQVLDVGCGIGEFLDRYQPSLGVDINPLVIRYCQAKGHHGCVSGAYTLPFATGSFDGVLASNILEHLASAETAVAEAVRVLKPDGVLVATVPQEAGFQHDATHVKMIQQSHFLEIAQKFSLNQTESYFFPFHIRWPGKILYFCELRAVFRKV
jgi:SAM-dependent methyltransferase